MRKWIKRIIVLSLIFFVLGATSSLLINYRIKVVTQEYIISSDDAPNSEAALVLGAYVYQNGNVSPILADRLDVGIELYNNGTVDKLLLSGDHGQKRYDEVNAMKQYTLLSNIIQEDIFLDHAGFNTYQSMYRAKEVFQAKKLIIVTQSYHLPRAIYIARKLGMDAYGVASDKHYYPRINQYKQREFLARCKDFVLVNFLKPKPKYLGEVIDLTGNGEVTYD